jgi:hypothetical protein
MATPTLGPTRFGYENSDEPLESRCLELRSYLSLIDTLVGAGLAPPTDWQQLRDRLSELGEAVAHGNVMQRRLCEAVLTGDGDIPALYSSALSEFSAHAPDVLGPIHCEVLAELQRIGQPHAAACWRILRDRVNTAAKSFASCCSVVNPAATADQVVNDGHQRQAWLDAEEFAQQLEASIEPVIACAEILRGGQPSGFGGSRIGLEIPIFVANAQDLQKRRLTEAWTDSPERTLGGPLTTDMTAPTHQPSRCGRWGRLAAINAEIRCAEDPNVELYSFPKPMGVKFVTPPGPSDNPKKPVLTPFDPEDEVTPRSPLARLRDSLARRQPVPTNLLDTVADTEEPDHGAH